MHSIINQQLKVPNDHVPLAVHFATNLIYLFAIMRAVQTEAAERLFTLFPLNQKPDRI